MSLLLRIGALVVGVAVVLAGALLVFVENAAAPPPAQVLASARSYAAGRRSIAFTVAEDVSLPSGSSTLVRHRSAVGTAVVPSSSDMTVTEGGASVEYRTTAAGLWVRAVGSQGWVSVPGYMDYETSVLPGPAGPLTALADRLADGAVIGPLLAGAHGARRHGGAARQVDVAFGPGVAGGVTLTGVLSTDDRNRPTGLSVHAVYHDATVDVSYALTWKPPITISPPPL